MKALATRGAIVNVTSFAGLDGTNSEIMHAAAKGAIMGTEGVAAVVAD